MFVRKKRAGTRVYHYLVKTERVDGKVCQRHIYYLGKHASLQAAIDACRATIAKLKRGAFEMKAACLKLAPGDPRIRFNQQQAQRLLASSRDYEAKVVRLCHLAEQL